MSLPLAVAIWAGIVLLAAFAGIRLGYSGPAISRLRWEWRPHFLLLNFSCCAEVSGTVQGALGQRGAVVAALVPLFAVLIYSMGVGGNWKYTLIGAAYAVLPALLLAGERGPFGSQVRGLCCGGNSLVTR